MAKTNGFNFRIGRSLARKYLVEEFLGGGWEGEVYKVVERKTGVRRAAKVFYPRRNVRDRAVRYYATKLDRLRRCPIVIQYHNSETIWHHGQQVTCLISEFVDGELLSDFILRQPGRRLHPFEAMHLLHTLARGLEAIHAAREYHGDLHDDNIMIKRVGIGFDVKIVDFYHWGAPTAAKRREDIVQLIRIFYDAVGGRQNYADQAPVVKDICRGLRRDLIMRRFPTATRLREHLETVSW